MSTKEMLETLVSFDTTSRNSNLELIEFIQGVLDEEAIPSQLTFDRSRNKANLWATIGPPDRSGIVLSGHTDVVPVDGQQWETDPFSLVESDGRLFGRGTSDMKGFIAVCLTSIPKIKRFHPELPIHFAFSYDEEIGCVGVRELLKSLSTQKVKPAMCLVGEPTDLRVIRGHKGRVAARCHFKGEPCHSSQTHRGVNAIEMAAEGITYLKRMGLRFKQEGPFDDECVPPYTTVQTGVIEGGSALNIVPEHCSFEFEMRGLPSVNTLELADEFFTYCRSTLEPEMKKGSPQSGINWEINSEYPPLDIDRESEVVKLIQTLTGESTSTKVSFGTEAGLFQNEGIPAVVCGPGSIDQAHRPNEYISIGQLDRCERLVEDVVAHFARGADQRVVVAV